MKTLLVCIALSFAIVNTATSQVMQKKVLTATPVVQSAVVKKSAVMMNTHNQQYKTAKMNIAANSSYAVKLVLYSKTVSFPDNTKVHINLRKNPSYAGQAANVQAKSRPATPAPDNGFVCTADVVSLSATSTDFMNNNYSAQTAHIFPGAIYTYDHLYDGSFREETANRNPLTIGTDNPNINGSTFETVNDPTQFNISNSISKIYSRFTGPAANESTSYQIFESDNTSDLDIKVGAGGSGYGFSFSNVFNTQNQEQHYYLTIDARKTLFTISTAIPDSGFFKGNANSTSPMVVMGSVSYGVRVLANLDFTFKSQKEMDDFKAAYSGYGVNANVNFNILSSNTALNQTINAYVIGGSSAQTSISFTKSQLQQSIQNILQSATYQNARPISYELFDLQGDVIGEESATDEFTVRHCVPANAPTTLQSGFATMQSADDGKDKDTHYTLGLVTSNNQLAASYVNNSNSDEYTANSSRTVPLTISTSTIGSNLITITPHTYSRADFPNGGHVHLSITPNGHDTWRIGKLTIQITFADTPTRPITMTWANITVSQDSRDYDLYFDQGFNPRQ